MEFNVIVENVRSLFGEYKIPVRPLTVLVGENSSGKTTFLSVLTTLLNNNKYPWKNSFNDPPFDLGLFDNIVSVEQNNNRIYKYFKIGFEKIIDDKKNKAKTIATYGGDYGRIELIQVEISSINGHLIIEKKGNAYKVNIYHRSLEHSEPFNVSFVQDYLIMLRLFT